MRPSHPLFCLLALLGWLNAPASAQTRSAALVPFTENGRWGFIDSTGAVAIAARFAQVQPFVEGLAPAREGGYYGFINPQGQFVGPAAYDCASTFHGGLAAITHNQVPQLIDRTGHSLPLAHSYTYLAWQPGGARGGVWLGGLPATTRPRRHRGFQLLNTRGQLLSPDVFTHVGRLSQNRLVVQRAVWVAASPSGSWDTQTGVLDGQGRLVIPYRRFGSISAFQEGVAVAGGAAVQLPGAPPPRQCLIDTAGRILAQLPPDQRVLLYAEGIQRLEKWTTDPYLGDFERPVFADGVAQVRFGRAGQAPTSDSCELGIIDRQGRVLARYPGLRYLSPFWHGRAWAEDVQDNWYLVDKLGHRLTAEPLAAPRRPTASETGPTFAGGAEVAELADNKGFVALDSAGQVLRRTPPFAYDYQDNPPQQLGDIVLFWAADTTQHQGFWNWRTGLLVPPRFSFIDPAGYQHGLLAVVEDHRLGYLSPAGRYVWRAAPATNGPLNLDYMRRSFYQVASATRLPKYAGLGGWYQSANTPQRPDQARLTPARLTLQVAATATPGAFAPAIDGHHVLLANATADTVAFDAQDSSLYLTMQAQDASGQWRDIEYTPSSWCGNSYHQVFLAPGQGWQLTVPAYAGGLKTQLRLQLIRRKTSNPKKEVLLHSNSFAGSVNAAQFWRQEGHQALSIMDSYGN